MPYQSLKCESTSRHFQSGEGPSRGLLRDCETSRNLREALVDILSVDISSVDIVHVPGASHVTGTGSAICGTSACLGLGTPAAASSHTTHNVEKYIIVRSGLICSVICRVFAVFTYYLYI